MKILFQFLALCLCVIALSSSVALWTSYDSYVGGIAVAASVAITAILLVGFLRHSRIDMKQWLASVSACDYSYGWNGTGMAVDIKKKVLHLASPGKKGLNTKAYSFADVREWGCDQPSASITQAYGNVAIGTHAYVALGNAVEAHRAAKNTGFWVKVKDIENPSWFIKFGDNPAMKKALRYKNELLKWMEIFSQSING